ncbi:MAG: SDR family NAD(P)-dependent oxidoreductase [Pseudomonadales bacterium]|nr:SDR family NAD(P)-dependent oxidoreductase [Pseudomonadales bacterium]MBO7007407.1 SDR family NAD(P)-dependent oxidoreductase [Pseudomonadales bacterium]
MKNFEGKIAVITGGAGGIGLGMAKAFASRGMKLVLADLDEALLAAARTEFETAGVPISTQLCDVSKLEQVEALAELAMDQFGAVHVVCSNAGVGLPTSARNMKLSDWEWIINVDLWGPIYAVNTFLPLLEQQDEGHINATSSVAGVLSSQMMGAYNVAKHGVVALMAATERELRAKQSAVHASVLLPGPINTNISKHSVTYRPGGGKPKSDSKKAGNTAKNIQTSLEQGMQPDEVGELVASSIEEDKFWILTHPKWLKLVQKQYEAMMDDRSLIRI